MKKILAIAAAAATIAFATPASAQWYAMIGIGYGDANFNGNDLGLSNGTVDNTDTTYSLRVGYDLNKYFALELGYAFLGKYKYSGFAGPVEVTGSAKANSLDFSVVGTLPFTPEFAGYGRIGVARSQRDVNANTNTLTGNQDVDETEATYGLGLRYLVDKTWGVYFEWSKNDEIKVDNYTLGVKFGF